MLAVFVYDRWRRRGARAHAPPPRRRYGCSSSRTRPYIATDFVHLQRDPLAPYWYDAVTIAAFAWMGVLLGFASLYLMQTAVRQWRGAVAGWIFAFFAIGLGSLGIYLGRFLRLNSWDALEHPSVLPRILHTVARDPFAYQEAIAVTLAVHAGAELCVLPALQLRRRWPGAGRGALIGACPGVRPQDLSDSAGCATNTDVASKPVEQLESVVIRFAGDSGDGMQLTGGGSPPRRR